MRGPDLTAIASRIATGKAAGTLAGAPETAVDDLGGVVAAVAAGDVVAADADPTSDLGANCLHRSTLRLVPMKAVRRTRQRLKDMVRSSCRENLLRSTGISLPPRWWRRNRRTKLFSARLQTQ